MIRAPRNTPVASARALDSESGSIELNSWQAALKEWEGRKEGGDIGQVHQRRERYCQTLIEVCEQRRRQQADEDVFRRCWGLLPFELRDFIYSFLGTKDSERQAISRNVSLVCRDWSLQFRPLLFSQLTLKTRRDYQMLYDILHSPHSSWLATHITSLALHGASLTTRGWMTLAQSLPSLKIVSLSNDRTKTSHYLTPSSRLALSLRSITSFTLEHYHFPSINTLLSVLGEVVYLETITLVEVTWPRHENMDPVNAARIPAGSFRSVQAVELRKCTSNTELPAWIFAAASTRYSSPARIIGSVRIPAETWSLITFIRHFMWDDHIQAAHFRMTCTTEDAYTFTGNVLSTSPSSDPTTLASVAVQVARSIPSPLRRQSTWSVHKIALSDGDEDYSNRTSYLLSRDLTMLPSLIMAYPSLSTFRILCGRSHSSPDFTMLSQKVTEVTSLASRITLQHNRDMPDGRFLYPALFGVTDADRVEAVQRAQTRRKEEAWRIAKARRIAEEQQSALQAKIIATENYRAIERRRMQERQVAMEGQERWRRADERRRAVEGLLRANVRI